jgi:hypothetical protein
MGRMYERAGILDSAASPADPGASLDPYVGFRSITEALSIRQEVSRAHG